MSGIVVNKAIKLALEKHQLAWGLCLVLVLGIIQVVYWLSYQLYVVVVTVELRNVVRLAPL